MQRYEYRVIPAPRKAEKSKGLKTTEARFAQALTNAMNDMAREGWDYLRTDTLPVEERVGLTGRTTVFQHMLVFSRPVTGVSQPLEASAPPIPTIAPSHAEKIGSADSPPRSLLVSLTPEGQAPKLPGASVTSGQAPNLGPAEGPLDPKDRNQRPQAAE